MTRALVLAAGRGERLRPLTDLTPKPLLPVLGASILERTLRCLAAAAVEAAAVNLHHLGAQIPARLGGEVDGMPLTYSPEAELLGTLGPLARLRSFLAESDPVLLVNGDSLCRWPVAALVDAFRSSEAVATLMISTAADPDRFGGGVSVDDGGRVLSFRGPPPRGTVRCGVFAGLHAISPVLLEGIAEAPSDIVRDLYEPALASGAVIRTVFTDCLWHDLGTPRRYLDGVLDEARGVGGSWLHAEAVASDSASIERSVIEAGAAVGSAAALSGTLLLANARVGAASRVRNSIVGPGVEIPAGVEIESIMVTAASPGGSPERTSL